MNFLPDMTGHTPTNNFVSCSRYNRDLIVKNETGISFELHRSTLKNSNINSDLRSAVVFILLPFTYDLLDKRLLSSCYSILTDDVHRNDVAYASMFIYKGEYEFIWVNTDGYIFKN